MLGLLLRLRFVLLLLRFLIVPVLAFSLAFFVFFLIGWSLYALIIAKTLKKLLENPYLYGPLLILEVMVVVLLLYFSVVYVNRIRRKYLK